MRIGQGYDVHRLAQGRRLILGGVDIPYEKGLLGHSDADVLVHAVMDALLGAAALGDIGQHFPDTDPAYEGISSIALLEKVGELLDGKGYVIENMMEGLMKPCYLEDLDKIPEDAQKVDVRTEAEYANGAIPGFKNIPLDSLRERLEELDLTKKIYITCQIGLRGYLAQRILAQHGAETFNLAGGYRLYEMAETDRRAMAAVPKNCTQCGMEL